MSYKVIMKKMEAEQNCTIIYNAAKDGKLNRLKLFLDHKSKEEVSYLVHAKTNGATPLIMASRNGHHEVVAYLVEKCNIKVEQEGSVMFDGETIEGAPPLWCAAAAGHLLVVKYLVEHGANVNKTTYTNSTPLRAACFDGHFEVVKFLVSHGADIEISNRHGHTCLMISCYKKHLVIVEYLLKLKADINRKSMKGNTALHDCAESGSLEVMKLLLKYGAVMTKDHYNMTPLMAAAVAGFKDIVEYLITFPDCSREESVDALELLGATYVDRKKENLAAVECWLRAMKIRWREGTYIIPKVSCLPPCEAYEYALEAQTTQEIENLITDPDELRMQALLVRERILGPSHPDTSYYIRYRGALYADMGNVSRCISLWLYALNMQQNSLEPISPMIQSNFLSFAELFSFMTKEWRDRKDILGCLKFDHLLSVVELVTEELRRGAALIDSQKKTTAADIRTRNLSSLNRTMLIALHLLCLMCKLENVLPDMDRLLFRKEVYQLVKVNAKGNKSNSLLHIACSYDTSEIGRHPICKFPDWNLVNLLIEVGADVNALNADRDTPLHVAASMDVPYDGAVIKLLIASGSHLDACNNNGLTVEDLVTTADLHKLVSPMNHLNLQCLASRQIVKSRLRYKGLVSTELEKMIDFHGGTARRPKKLPKNTYFRRSVEK